jgi:glycosyltransferase involved in cell wall biosynthesis
VFHLWSAIGLRKFALWGHGRNVQVHDTNPMAEFLKKRLLGCCDWWFAYTTETKAYLEAAGVPGSKITPVQNAANDMALIEAADRITPEQVEQARRRLGIRGRNIALFIGSLYPEKRLPFLIEAARQLRGRVDDFELLVVGAGPEEPLVREACASSPFIHFVGPATGGEKLVYFRLAKLVLMPGLVGLASADAINFGVPLVTIQLPYHSPEIAYVKDGVNGAILAETTSPAEYANAVAAYLRDDPARDRLRAGCLQERYRYTAEVMAHRFATGVRQCLGIGHAIDSWDAEAHLAASV